MAREIEFGTNVKSVKKDVNYIGREFSTIRANLIEFAKQYFPTAYNDFNEASPGMMFIEMAAYVGDVLNFYIDNQFREALLHSAEEKKNVFKIVQSMGYKPTLSKPSTTIAEISVEVPAEEIDSDTYRPDLRYAPVVNAPTLFTAQVTDTQFRLLDDINFKVSSSLDPRFSEVSQTDDDVPTHYKLTKLGVLQSGEIFEEDFTFGNSIKFNKIILAKNNVVEITSCIDDDGNRWYEVPYLAQDTVYADIENTSVTSPDLSQYSTETPYLLKLIKTARRFTTYIRSDGRTEVRFGSGISSNADEEMVPNPDNVGSSLGTGISKLDASFDPSNFLNTKTFGQSPGNITLTFKYTHGGSLEDNVLSNQITEVESSTIVLSSDGLDTAKVSDVKDSLTVTNPEPATGGASSQDIDEIKLSSMAYMATQNRAVTMQDYITRVYSLPQKYGNIAKAYIVQDEQLDQAAGGEDGDKPDLKEISNPLALNLYVLGYDYKRNFVQLNEATKTNLKIYLSQYRVVTDAINIKDAFIINVKIKFAIITQRGNNKNEVLMRCIDKVKKHFDVKKWQINQPIILSDIAYQISLCKGVASVVPPTEDNPEKSLILIENKYEKDDGYSGNVYDLDAATKEGVIYPSLDPCIFEVKFPDIDIEGKVVGDI
tara:strand:- start:888 stop:2849 length:1962 start_codon:yes stop_codon:yes gene_type:complete